MCLKYPLTFPLINTYIKYYYEIGTNNFLQHFSKFFFFFSFKSVKSFNIVCKNFLKVIPPQPELSKHDQSQSAYNSYHRQRSKHY